MPLYLVLYFIIRSIALPDSILNYTGTKDIVPLSDARRAEPIAVRRPLSTGPSAPRPRPHLGGVVGLGVRAVRQRGRRAEGELLRAVAARPPEVGGVGKRERRAVPPRLERASELQLASLYPPN